MNRIARASIASLGLVAAGAGIWAFETACRTAQATPKKAEKATKYHCPMHPAYVSDRPGICPICGMKLVPLAEGSPVPTPGGPGHEAHGDGPVDRVAVTLDAERREMLGVRSEPVSVTNLGHTIRTVGRVTVDERRIHHIHTKVEGYVDQLYVDFTGKFVRRGEPLLSIYSPELVATQEEYLLALRAQRTLGTGQVPSVARGGVNLLEAARRRLLWWDISPAVIGRLERTGEVKRSLELYSPGSGFVVRKTAVHGMRVMPSDTLFDIADLSRLWVLADVYEQDLGSVRLGMPAQLSVTYLPGQSWKGSVTWIAPMVEEKTRTVKVRIEVGNEGDQLKPEMFADVSLEVPSGRSLIIPEGAVIRSGQRDLVFLDEGDGRFTPREVRLGRKGGNGVEILAGLAEGERVVTSANFLLDSESSLKAALAAATRPAAGSPGAPAGGVSAPAPAHRH